MDIEDIKDEIKRRTDIVALVSRYVTLQRAGNRLRGRCPFHEESQPSFYVDPAGGFFKCFGCQAGGDVFSFLMKIEGLNFPEAAERLAEMVGLSWRPAPGARKASKQRDVLRVANDHAARHFRDRLSATTGNAARQYLADRGITVESQQRFGIGYAPAGWDGLLRALAGKGISGQTAHQCGLVKPRDAGGYYDTFRNRIIFPICDVSGQAIGFGGRTLDPEEAAKYINSPETALFKKSRTVYGLDVARQAISVSKQVIVVEGYTDVIALHQAEIANTVACLGTATTEDHLRLLSRYADEIVFLYDADAAGMAAALRHVEIFEKAAADVKVAILPSGLDPDEAVRSIGVEGLNRVIAERLSLIEYQLRAIYQQHRDCSGIDRAAAAREIVKVLVKVSDEPRRDALVAMAADWWGLGNPGRTEAMERVIAEELNKMLPASRGRSRHRSGRRESASSDRGFITEAVTRVADGVPSGSLKLEANMLAAALADEKIARRLSEVLEAAEFVDDCHRAIYAQLLEHLESSQSFLPQELIGSLQDETEVGIRALELWMCEIDCVLEWEVLEANIANFKKHVAMREWEQHQKAVVDALERGELSHNSPEYVEHQRRTVELFGPGSSGFHRHESLWGTLGCAATGSDGDTGGDAQLLEDNEGS
jgi:DNA primase